MNYIEQEKFIHTVGKCEATRGDLLSDSKHDRRNIQRVEVEVWSRSHQSNSLHHTNRVGGLVAGHTLSQ